MKQVNAKTLMNHIFNAYMHLIYDSLMSLHLAAAYQQYLNADSTFINNDISIDKCRMLMLELHFGRKHIQRMLVLFLYDIPYPCDVQCDVECDVQYITFPIQHQ